MSPIFESKIKDQNTFVTSNILYCMYTAKIEGEVKSFKDRFDFSASVDELNTEKITYRNSTREEGIFSNQEINRILDWEKSLNREVGSFSFSFDTTHYEHTTNNYLVKTPSKAIMYLSAEKKVLFYIKKKNTKDVMLAQSISDPDKNGTLLE